MSASEAHRQALTAVDARRYRRQRYRPLQQPKVRQADIMDGDEAHHVKWRR
jgi:hypothetical protein